MAYEDLLKDTSTPSEDGNYFNLVITDLNPGDSYPVQFRWVYTDGTFSDWSAVRSITPPALGVPSEPTLSVNDVVGGAGFIKVTWGGAVQSGSVIPNLDRVDVHISGTTFGDGTKPAGSFKSAGTQTFAATPGIYIVQLKIISNNGTESFYSTSRTVTVTSVAEPVETPTLPTGLSVSAAPFAVAVNWNGSYSGNDTFLGFKSIDVYAVSSDLGSTTTSGISDTNLVGSLTVNDTTNRINIGLDNLKQALSLSTTADAYTATIFFYYISVNKDGTKYGSPTYTRINTSSVNPVKANLVDLTSGLISIENLVAGNGSFSSWLRVGASGGARIELSGTNNFINNGYTVKKGLTAYSSGNTETLGFDLATGALALKGSLSATSISTASTKFSVDSNGLMSASDATISGSITANGGYIGGITIAADGLQNSGNTFKIDSSGQIRSGSSTGAAIVITPSGGLFHSSDGGATKSGKLTLSPTQTSIIGGWEINTDHLSSPSGNIYLYSAGKTGDTSLRIQAGDTFKVYDDGSFIASNAAITGAIYANEGWIGGSDGWLILGPVIQAGTVGILSLGDYGSIVTGSSTHTYSITQLSGEFVIDETLNGTTTNILQTSGIDDGTNGRIFLGASKRQVEVIKSAQISGTGTTSTDPSLSNPYDTSSTSIAYRSGGLRNMYTVANTFNSSLYPSAKSGDVLLVYDTTVLV